MCPHTHQLGSSYVDALGESEDAGISNFMLSFLGLDPLGGWSAYVNITVVGWGFNLKNNSVCFCVFSSAFFKRIMSANYVWNFGFRSSIPALFPSESSLITRCGLGPPYHRESHKLPRGSLLTPTPLGSTWFEMLVKQVEKWHHLGLALSKAYFVVLTCAS